MDIYMYVGIYKHAKLLQNVIRPMEPTHKLLFK